MKTPNQQPKGATHFNTSNNLYYKVYPETDQLNEAAECYDGGWFMSSYTNGAALDDVCGHFVKL